LKGLIEEKSQKDVYSFYVVGHSIHKIVKMLEDLGFTDDILKSGSGTNTAIVNLVTRTYYPVPRRSKYGWRYLVSWCHDVRGATVD